MTYCCGKCQIVTPFSLFLVFCSSLSLKLLPCSHSEHRYCWSWCPDGQILSQYWIYHTVCFRLFNCVTANNPLMNWNLCCYIIIWRIYWSNSLNMYQNILLIGQHFPNSFPFFPSLIVTTFHLPAFMDLLSTNMQEYTAKHFHTTNTTQQLQGSVCCLSITVCTVTFS